MLGNAEFPRRAQPYAHSLLCVSAAAEQLRSLAGTLRANSYNIYSSALPRDTGTWSAESLAAAYEMLLDEPEGGAAEADVVMNEITSIEGACSFPQQRQGRILPLHSQHLHASPHLQGLSCRCTPRVVDIWWHWPFISLL